MTESMDMDTKMQKFDEEIEQILDLLEEKAYFRARDEILKHNEVDIAEILEEILEESGIDKTIIIYRMLPKDISAEVFSYLPSDDPEGDHPGHHRSRSFLHHGRTGLR